MREENSPQRNLLKVSRDGSTLTVMTMQNSWFIKGERGYLPKGDHSTGETVIV